MDILSRLSVGLLAALPKELTLLIVSFLDVSSRFSLSCVAKSCVSHRVVHRPERLSSPVMRTAAIRDNKNMVLLDAIENGYTELFKWLTSDEKHFTKHYARLYCDKAANKGSFEIL